MLFRTVRNFLERRFPQIFFSEAIFYVTFLILGRLGIVRGHIFRKVQPLILVLQISYELSSNGKSSALMPSFSNGGGMGGLSPTWDLF